MKPKEAVLESRKQYLKARIAAQRTHLAWQMGAVEAPLHAFEVARGVGATLRRYAPLIGGATAILSVVLVRGGVVRKGLRVMKLANMTTRWMALARIGMRLAQQFRGPARARTY
jgi:hypothetical protein